MNLKSALSRIAYAFNLNPLELDMASHEDPHGGYHAAYDDGFPVGSMWRVEGQFLYALIRALKPVNVLELGTWHGCSATHILQALHDNGTSGDADGTLDCVDNRAYGDIVIGDMIPLDLRLYANIHAKSLEGFIADIAPALETHRYDLIFEDAMHTVEQVELVWKNADRLLTPGGVIISHDAMHAIAGPVVQEGIARAGYAKKVVSVLIEPADCGFAVWRKAL
jgi:predicted O-methyltransferase YrrM